MKTLAEKTKNSVVQFKQEAFCRDQQQPAWPGHWDNLGRISLCWMDGCGMLFALSAPCSLANTERPVLKECRLPFIYVTANTALGREFSRVLSKLKRDFWDCFWPHSVQFFVAWLPSRSFNMPFIQGNALSVNCRFACIRSMSSVSSIH